MALTSNKAHHLTQRELESVLWAAANALRGPVDAGDFKSYVFPVLFFKWLSDMHDYAHLEAVAVLGADWSQTIEDEDFQTFAVPDGTHWDDVFAVTRNTGAKLGASLLAIQEANPGMLTGIFGDVNWGNAERIPESALRRLLDAFHELTLNPDHVSGDMLGAAYEYLLREFAEASGKKAGEFFTPRHVVHLLVDILDPSPGDSVCDPACGSAGMLVETVEAVRLKGGNPNSLWLAGQEANLTTAGIARMNLYLHDIPGFEIARGDTFREPKLLHNGGLRRFDIVIANPPFSLKNWGADGWAKDPYGRALGGITPPGGNGDWAWIQHMISIMKPGSGRVGVVMPHGALFRGGGEAKARQWAIDNDLLESVIGLPNNLFYSTSIPVCLMIFRAKKSLDRKDKVLVIDARGKFKPGANQNSMSDDDIKMVGTAYREGIEGDDGLNLRLVDRGEIAGNGYDLNIGRYIATETAAEADVDAALAVYREAAEALIAAQAVMDLRLKEAGFDA